MSNSKLDSFRTLLLRKGLDYDGPIIANGKLHRFKACGDREKNSWFVLYAGPPVAGAFGCWKRGIKETWCERNGQLSQVEWDGTLVGFGPMDAHQHECHELNGLPVLSVGLCERLRRQGLGPVLSSLRASISVQQRNLLENKLVSTAKAAGVERTESG